MNTVKIDEAVLALLYLGRWDDYGWGARSWKSFDWQAMDRLHEKDLISNPATRARSVILTEEGLSQAQEAFNRLFGQDTD